jgi:hypothetical protein
VSEDNGKHLNWAKSLTMSYESCALCILFMYRIIMVSYSTVIQAMGGVYSPHYGSFDPAWHHGLQEVPVGYTPSSLNQRY